MEPFDVEALFNDLTAYLSTTGPMEWSIGGGIALLLLIAGASTGGKRQRRKKAAAIAPKLAIGDFQVSPLGKDAYFKIYNHGNLARLSQIIIKGKGHIQVKNAIAGHEIVTGDSYRIFLETTGNRKINTDFIVDLTYIDQAGNVYQQDFPMSKPKPQPARLVKFAS